MSLCLCGLISVNAQDYPKEIRGYKVHKTKITVKNEGEKTDKKDGSEAYITVTEPTVEDVSLTGVTMEASAEISAVEQSGKVDFLTFKDFRVNGLKVDIEEYQNSFSFEKNKPIKLPRPIKVFVGTGQSLLGAIGEMRDPKEEWTVTGTVFVFGKFKKMGFNFKRVIPVEINIKIKNPLKNNR
ncbi:MAG: hypothetical protein ABWZ66_05605 [Pyrinomonadaceae bacterium]